MPYKRGSLPTPEVLETQIQELESDSNNSHNSPNMDMPFEDALNKFGEKAMENFINTLSREDYEDYVLKNHRSAAEIRVIRRRVKARVHTKTHREKLKTRIKELETSEASLQSKVAKLQAEIARERSRGSR